MDNGSKVPINVILKLFDQVKESSSNNTEAIKEVKDALKEWLIYGKTQPSHKEIIEVLGSVRSWIKTMVLVVVITFTLLTTTFIFVRSSVDSIAKEHVNSAVDDKVEIILDKLEKLKNETN